MELMTLDEFKDTTEAKTVNLPQYLCLAADLHKLHQVMPLPPVLDDDSYSQPIPKHQWFGRVGTQMVIIECVANYQASKRYDGSLFIITPPIDGPDWTILFPLQGLPSFIFPTRPYRICSKNDNPKAVVCRPDPHGWEDEVYFSPTWNEAEDLLAYLRQDDFNRDCYVGDFEPPGTWEAMTADRKEVLACYSDKNSTLRVACEMSLQKRCDIVVVDALDRVSGRQYRIRNGFVVR